VSAVLCAAVCVLWVRSELSCDTFFHKDERVRPHSVLWIAASYRGAVWLYHESYDARQRRAWPPDLVTHIGSGEFPDLLALFGFEELGGEPAANTRFHWPVWSSYTDQGSVLERSQLLICPHWLLVLASSVLPAAWLAARWRRGPDAAAAFIRLAGTTSAPRPTAARNAGSRRLGDKVKVNGAQGDDIGPFFSPCHLFTLSPCHPPAQ
jgi:hypothetical protein